MPSISPTLPTQTYLALPSPASVRASSAAQATTRQGAAAATGPQTDDYTELQPVTAVPPVTRQPQQVDNDNDQTDNGSTGSKATGSDAGSSPVGQRTTAAATGADQGQNNRIRVTIGSPTGQPSTGFITQSLSQETIGAGLHIEPWQTALSSYNSAAALPASTWSSSAMSLTV